MIKKISELLESTIIQREPILLKLKHPEKLAVKNIGFSTSDIINGLKKLIKAGI